MLFEQSDAASKPSIGAFPSCERSTTMCVGGGFAFRRRPQVEGVEATPQTGPADSTESIWERMSSTVEPDPTVSTVSGGQVKATSDSHVPSSGVAHGHFPGTFAHKSSSATTLETGFQLGRLAPLRTAEDHLDLASSASGVGWKIVAR